MERAEDERDLGLVPRTIEKKNAKPRRAKQYMDVLKEKARETGKERWMGQGSMVQKQKQLEQKKNFCNGLDMNALD